MKKHIGDILVNIFYNRETIANNMKYSKCLSYPLPFYPTQTINPFLDSRISANHDKVEGLLACSEILIKKGLFF